MLQSLTYAMTREQVQDFMGGGGWTLKDGGRPILERRSPTVQELEKVYFRLQESVDISQCRGDGKHNNKHRDVSILQNELEII
jgi:hypothetical protein